MGSSTTTGSPRSRSTPPPSGVDPGAVRELIARTGGDGGPPGHVDTHETHISWVFVVGERAFKLKKPVVLEFLDYGTPARRREMCEAEVALGRRLAPHVYRGVCAIVRRGDELALARVGDPRALDYLVEMNAFAEDATLAAAIAAGRVPRRLPGCLGARLAAFHAGCAARPVAEGASRARREITSNLQELRALTAGTLDPLLDRHARFLDACVTARAADLDERGRRGRLREGHGDLRAEHVLLAPELAVVDCLEFDPALRTVDTADELGFLAMDLLRLGAEPIARETLRAYRQAGGDCGSDALVWTFAVHRALVRAKVALVRAAQIHGSSVSDEADSLLGVADRCAWRARSIDVLVICGGSAAGKTTLSQRLSERLGIPCLNTDVVRKNLLGLAPELRAGTDAYTPEMNRRTYRELGRRTRALLNDSPSVIVDGTFQDGAERAEFAAELDNPRSIVIVQCRIPPETARRRARERAARGPTVSDATEEIIAAQTARPNSIWDVDPNTQLILRTDRPLAAIQADLDALLDVRLRAGAWLDGSPTPAGEPRAGAR